jgi:hypothetical protein
MILEVGSWTEEFCKKDEIQAEKEREEEEIEEESEKEGQCKYTVWKPNCHFAAYRAESASQR